YDPKRGEVQYPYVYESGVRIDIGATSFDPVTTTGVFAHVYRTRAPVVINEGMAEWLERLGSSIFPGTELERSALHVPLMVGGQVRGQISLVDMQRENAF